MMANFRNNDSAIFSRDDGPTESGNNVSEADNAPGDTQQVRKQSRSRKSTKDYIDALRGPKGIPRLWVEMPKHTKLKGKGHERRDLRAIMRFYREWLFGWAPELAFEDGVKKMEMFGSTIRVKNTLCEFREKNRREWQEKLGILGEDKDWNPEKETGKNNENAEIKNDVNVVDRDGEKTATTERNPKPPAPKPPANNADNQEVSELPPTDVETDEMDMMAAAMAPSQPSGMQMGNDSGGKLTGGEMSLNEEELAFMNGFDDF